MCAESVVVIGGPGVHRAPTSIPGQSAAVLSRRWPLDFVTRHRGCTEPKGGSRSSPRRSRHPVRASGVGTYRTGQGGDARDRDAPVAVSAGAADQRRHRTMVFRENRERNARARYRYAGRSDRTDSPPAPVVESSAGPRSGGGTTDRGVLRRASRTDEAGARPVVADDGGCNRVPGFPAATDATRALGGFRAATQLAVRATVLGRTVGPLDRLRSVGAWGDVPLADRAALSAGEPVCRRQGTRHQSPNRTRHVPRFYRGRVDARANHCRHTHATHALARGAELTTVRDNLRHASIATTSIYLHSDDVKRARQIRDAFAD